MNFTKRAATPVQDLGGRLEAERAFAEAASEEAVERITAAKKVIETQSQRYVDEEKKAEAIAEAQTILAGAGVIDF